MDKIDLSTPDRIFTHNGKEYHRPEIISGDGDLMVQFFEVKAIEKEDELIEENLT